MTSGRLLRYVSFLTAFDNEVIFMKGIENINADCLSRAPIAQKILTDDMIFNKETNQVCIISTNKISTEHLIADTFREETDVDEQLSSIKQKNSK
ncbi:hypothetical protein CDAR_33521 [Caerostris darwini]|uniref:Uncharacterized protein n=1 Tax=Caerostris darwini TaxID=1538125 RepID=A0AAV4QPP6_9ARAC|nr:hypothetical protein CDAR_33521 [Caerostris darwini]